MMANGFELKVLVLLLKEYKHESNSWVNSFQITKVALTWTDDSLMTKKLGIYRVGIYWVNTAFVWCLMEVVKLIHN